MASQSQGLEDLNPHTMMDNLIFWWPVFDLVYGDLLQRSFHPHVCVYFVIWPANDGPVRTILWPLTLVDVFGSPTSMTSPANNNWLLALMMSLNSLFLEETGKISVNSAGKCIVREHFCPIFHNEMEVERVRYSILFSGYIFLGRHGICPKFYTAGFSGQFQVNFT